MVEFLAPRYRLSTADGGGTAVTDATPIGATLTAEDAGNGLRRCRVVWVNRTDAAVEFQGAVTLRAGFAATRYLIPCVSMNGNEWGAGGEPKGMTRDGQPWVFAYDRMAIPACSVVEDKALAISLFASDCDDVSLRSACSVFVEDGVYHQQLWWPDREAPVTYAGRDKYGPAYEPMLTLGGGESVAMQFYCLTSTPRYPNFGIADTLDVALDLFHPALADAPDPDALWNDGIAFARSLITHYEAADGTRKKGFIIGWRPDATGEFAYRGDDCFELGWCGQNIMLARMLIEDYRRSGNRQNLDDALEIIDTRIAACTAPSGLIAAQLKHCDDLLHASADACNLGYGTFELLRIHRALRMLGIERPDYLAAARGVCDFFDGHFSPEHGFGKQWRLDGTLLDAGGTIGAFVIPALCAIYRETGDTRYLDCAKAAFDLYVSRDLDAFACTAGALDTSCVDKETVTPLLIAALQLHAITENDRYLAVAERAAYYFCAWMMHVQPLYGDCDITRQGLCVAGMTAVSAQHHHLDEYGLMVVPYLRDLAVRTKDARWKLRADMLWQGANQAVSDGTLMLHGKLRPRGSQNEALFHCRWVFTPGCGRGDLNDWLVAWPCAYRLAVLVEK